MIETSFIAQEENIKMLLPVDNVVVSVVCFLQGKSRVSCYLGSGTENVATRFSWYL